MKHPLPQPFAASEVEKTPDKLPPPNTNTNWRWICFATFLLFLFTLPGHRAIASHFKNGYMTYTYIGGGRYNVLIVGYWDKNMVGSVLPRYESRPKIDNVPQTVSKTLMPDGKTVEHIQKQVVTFSKPGKYEAYWKACCWEDGANFDNIYNGVFATFNYDPEAPSSSPRFHDLPYFNFTAGQPINYRIGAEDPDGHEQEFSLAAPHYATTDVYKELLESGFQLQKDGTILWENPVAGKWLVNFKVSEKINGVLTGAYISWEVIINVSDINSNQAPTFGALEPKVVRAGETLSFQIEASDAASQEVNLSAFGPTFGQGATFTQTVSGNLTKGTYSWAAPQDATGTYYVQFLAKDNQSPALISQASIAISIVECNEFFTTYTNVSQPCLGSNNGQLSLGATEEGYSPYEYSLDNGQTFQSSTDFENLAPGTYTGIVRDAAGCTSNSVAITLEEAPLPEVTLSLPATVCADAGAVALNGGSPAGGVYQGTGVENGFFYPERAGAGIHTIHYTYTNSNGCSNTAAQDLRVNETLVADAGDDAVVYASAGNGSDNGSGTGYGSGNGSNKGQGAENGVGQEGRCTTLTATATGGSAPYTYLWSNGETTQSISVCPQETSTYYLTITDALDCTATSQAQVVVEDPQTASSQTSSSNSKVEISAYPNPLTATSQLKINMPEADQITVEITDMSGNVVKKLYTGPIAAKQTMSFDLNSKLGNGKVYIARVKGAKGVHHCRLMHK